MKREGVARLVHDKKRSRGMGAEDCRQESVLVV
jgi:hypothetical protein